MEEVFLHYLWRHRRFAQNGLKTCCGKTVSIVSPGLYNLGAGPDFSSAAIAIDGMLWAGDVEVHLRPDDWFKHNHHTDDAYKKVVLHVVYENLGKAPDIPVLELKPLVDDTAYGRFRWLMERPEAVACSSHLSTITPLTLSNWLDRLFVERLETKAQPILEYLGKNQNDLVSGFCYALTLGMAHGANKEAFRQLSGAIQWKEVIRLKGNPHAVKGILLGSAGLLGHASLKMKEAERQKLNQEYSHYRNKLQAVQQFPLWKFGRTRPGNFPTLRLLQLAELATHTHTLYTAAANPDVKHLAKELSACCPQHGLTPESAHLIVLNGIAPFAIAAKKISGGEAGYEKVLGWAEQLPPENNAVTRGFSHLSKPTNALQSQAYIQLHKAYCTGKRCLDCAVGNSILRQPA